MWGYLEISSDDFVRGKLLRLEVNVTLQALSKGSLVASCKKRVLNIKAIGGGPLLTHTPAPRHWREKRGPSTVISDVRTRCPGQGQDATVYVKPTLFVASETLKLLNLQPPLGR